LEKCYPAELLALFSLKIMFLIMPTAIDQPILDF